MYAHEVVERGSMNKIERAHQMYRDGRHLEALGFYSEALGIAKTRAQKIALHSNRAACYLKLHDFHKAAKECTSVLELDQKHTGALMLRAQTLVTLKEYNSALFDVNRLIDLNPSSEVYQNLHASLKTQLSLATIPEAESEFEEEEEEEDHEAEAKFEEDEEEVNEETNDLEGPGNETECSVSENIAVVEAQPSDKKSSSWQAITKPKGHTKLDYSRWDQVDDDSDDDKDDDDDDDESQPQFRFRVRTVGVRAVK